MNPYRILTALVPERAVQGVMAGLIVAGWAFLRDAGSLYVELLQFSPLLIGALTGAFVLDFISGLIASVRTGRRITSSRAAEGLWKGVGYAFVIVVLVMFTNACEESAFGGMLSLLTEAVILTFGVVETISIAENLFGLDDAKKLLSLVGKVLSGQWGKIDEGVFGDDAQTEDQQGG